MGGACNASKSFHPAVLITCIITSAPPPAPGMNLSASRPPVLPSLHEASGSQRITQAFPLCIIRCIKWLLLHAVPVDGGDYSALCPFGSLTPCILHRTHKPSARANLSLLCTPTCISSSCQSRQNSPTASYPRSSVSALYVHAAAPFVLLTHARTDAI